MRMLVTLEEFREWVNTHSFSFINYPHDPHKRERLRVFIDRFLQEIDLFNIAWDGGDPYMTVLEQAIMREIREETVQPLLEPIARQARRTPEEVAALKYFKSLDGEFQSFLMRLNQHDWYYRESDDLDVCRRGKAAEEELKREAQSHGSQWIRALDTFDPRK